MVGIALFLGSLLLGAEDARALDRSEMFQTLINPACSHCVDEARRAAGALRDDDRVLAWIRGEYDGGAIPYRWFLVPYRVIADSYGGVGYHPHADFVRGWPAAHDFRFHGRRHRGLGVRGKDAQ